MEYKVGQILYFVGSETARVIPALVVEEVIRTTIEGKEKNYIIQLPDDKKTKLDISKLPGASFSVIEKLKTHMTKTAEAAIQDMITNAVAMSEKAFGKQKQQETELSDEESSAVPIDLNQDIIPEEVLSVDMGNGIVGKVNIGDLNKVGV